MFPVVQRAKLVQKPGGRFAFKGSDQVAQISGWRVAQQEMDMVSFAAYLGNFALQFRCQMSYCFEQKISPLSGECFMPKLCAEHNVHGQVVNTVACTIKIKIPDTLAHGLDDLLTRCRAAVERMLKHRDWSSSKYYSDLVPCVVSKSLIAKYQRIPSKESRLLRWEELRRKPK